MQAIVGCCGARRKASAIVLRPAYVWSGVAAVLGTRSSHPSQPSPASQMLHKHAHAVVCKPMTHVAVEPAVSIYMTARLFMENATLILNMVHLMAAHCSEGMLHIVVP